MGENEKQGVFITLIPVISSVAITFVAYKYFHLSLGLVGAISLFIFIILLTMLSYDRLKTPQKVAFAGLIISSFLLTILFGYDQFINDIKITALHVVGLIFPPILIGNYLLKKQVKYKEQQNATELQSEKENTIPSSIVHKLTGAISFLMGTGFLYFTFGPLYNIPVTSNEDINLRFAIMIVAVSCSLGLITLGVLFYLGRLHPYFLTQDKFNKVKMDILGTIICFPVVVTFTIITFAYSKSTAWKIIMIFFSIALIWHLIDSFQKYRKYKESPPVEEIKYL